MTLVNWPQVDYWLTPLIAVTEAQRQLSLHKARELSLCFVRWLQTDAPRPDGGTGYPALRLCPEVLGTKMAWRPMRTSGRAVELPPSSLCWKPT